MKCLQRSRVKVELNVIVNRTFGLVFLFYRPICKQVKNNRRNDPNFFINLINLPLMLVKTFLTNIFSCP